MEMNAAATLLGAHTPPEQHGMMAFSDGTLEREVGLRRPTPRRACTQDGALGEYDLIHMDPLVGLDYLLRYQYFTILV